MLSVEALAPPPTCQGPVRGQEYLLESDSDNESVTDTTAPQPDRNVIPTKVLPSPRSSLPAPPPVPDAINESPVLPSSPYHNCCHTSHASIVSRPSPTIKP